MATQEHNSGPPAGSGVAAAQAGREKRWVALTSVLAAVLLTGMKLVVGLLTGSLGLLAEAAHSGLDLVAAIVTYLAVRFSDKPADPEHHYGHGKVENLSALIETLLLLLTCVWIIYEAVERLFFRTVPVEATIWSFVVIVISILVDIGRSRALMRAARKHNSQALEADALHFSTDVWSSLVVLGGLILVRLSGTFVAYEKVLVKADSVAALIVALIVVWVSVQLGRRTVDALVDRAPAGLAAKVERAVRRIDGILECRQIRLRPSGNQTFVDLTVGVQRGLSLESSHALGHAAEERIKAILPGADVVVHIDPVCGTHETLPERVRAIAANMGLTVHNVFATEGDGRVEVDLHVETDENLELARAHAQVDALEIAVRKDLPFVSKVTTHIEPAHAVNEPMRDVTASSADLVQLVSRTATAVSGIVECHEVTVRRAGRDIFLTMHCTFAAGRTVREVHEISSELERRLRREIPHLARVITHPEPTAVEEA